MDPMVATAASALVSAMATDAWQRTRDGAVQLWRRFRPQDAEAVGLELDGTRSRMIEGRPDGGTEALVSVWQRRIEDLLRHRPDAESELTDLLGRASSGTVMVATASDHGRVFQAGHDQTIHER
jgi:hypothetical protein